MTEKSLKALAEEYEKIKNMKGVSEILNEIKKSHAKAYEEYLEAAKNLREIETKRASIIVQGGERAKKLLEAEKKQLEQKEKNLAAEMERLLQLAKQQGLGKK